MAQNAQDESERMWKLREEFKEWGKANDLDARMFSDLSGFLSLQAVGGWKVWKALKAENAALQAEVERLRNENIDLSVRVDALNDLLGFKEGAPSANTTENRKLVRELWKETK